MDVEAEGVAIVIRWPWDLLMKTTLVHLRGPLHLPNTLGGVWLSGDGGGATVRSHRVKLIMFLVPKSNTVV